VWIKSCVRAGLDPRPRIHDLRHSHVAWLIAEGAPLPVIQARLGHEKITTTIDTYGHLMPDLQRAAADAASLVFARMPQLGDLTSEPLAISPGHAEEVLSEVVGKVMPEEEPDESAGT
jgi:hypothetical protein